MRVKAHVLPYLTGERFSSGLRVDFDPEPDDRVYRSRIDWLERMCAAKHVVHVGCVDHSAAQIKHKLERRKWLHARLAACTARCHGVDKDAPGIAFVRDELGYADVECMDLLQDECPAIKAARWDYLVLAEVLEHIDNPVDFLGHIKRRYANYVGQLIITVPNAFARENFVLARHGIEAINTDHRFWFTPYTITKVAVRAGLAPVKLLLCRNGVVKKRSIVKNARLRHRPFLRNNIIMIARWHKAHESIVAPA